jgi:eukaryotic-like serine/threonine-protein kinase
MPDPMILNNRYQLEKTLGSGGMAVVYQARDLELERSVAIKVLREDYSRDAGFRESFRQEARAAANLSHPNIVTVHDFGLDTGRLFIVMEYIPGTDLKSILQQQGRLPTSEALALMVQACSGVGYAHRAGLVHCDLKPQNMLITPDRRLKVTDFGIARALASIHPEEKSEIVWGSPQYFSPEQAAGIAPSPSSDVYSLGVVLYELLTGKPPFSASSSTELARLHREAAPVPPRQLNPAVPEGLEQVLLKVLSKEPSARYRTADQYGRVLMTIQNQLDQPDQPVPVPEYPVAPQVLSTRPSKSSTKPAYVRPASPGQSPLEIDWITIGLGLLALIAVGGLLPFFLWIYFLYNPLLP